MRSSRAGRWLSLFEDCSVAAVSVSVLDFFSLSLLSAPDARASSSFAWSCLASTTEELGFSSEADSTASSFDFASRYCCCAPDLPRRYRGCPRITDESLSLCERFLESYLPVSSLETGVGELHTGFRPRCIGSYRSPQSTADWNRVLAASNTASTVVNPLLVATTSQHSRSRSPAAHRSSYAAVRMYLAAASRSVSVPSGILSVWSFVWIRIA